ncbi:MAG: hypothetical protein HYX92_17870 [Chloroflexi bacterium]|nr:hypothetical protein [Chloroflexota bacterium]
MQLRKPFTVASCLLVSGLIMASCAPTASPVPTAASPAKAPEAPTAAAPARPVATPKPAAEQPGQGGVLSIGFFADVASFDLHQESAGATLLVIAPAFSGLLQYSPVEVGGIPRRPQDNHHGEGRNIL